MRFFLHLALVACLFPAAGCHSAYVEATVTNHTAKTIPLVEVDYPSASFGTQNLAPGTSFHYRFKVLGTGATKLLFTDAQHQDHSAAGPSFKEGDEGRLQIDINPGDPQWNFQPAGHS